MYVVLVVGPRVCGKTAFVWDAVRKLGDAAIGFPEEDRTMNQQHMGEFPCIIVPEVTRSDGAVDEVLAQLRPHGKIVAVVDHDFVFAIQVERFYGSRFDAMVAELQFLDVRPGCERLLERTAEVMVRADLADPVTLTALRRAGFSYSGDSATWQRWLAPARTGTD